MKINPIALYAILLGVVTGEKSIKLSAKKRFNSCSLARLERILSKRNVHLHSLYI